MLYLRYVVAGEVAGAREKLGGMEDMLTNLAPLSELPVARNMGTVSRFENAQSAALPHLVRERGNAQTISGGLAKVNRYRVNRRIADQLFESTVRAQPDRAFVGECPTEAPLEPSAARQTAEVSRKSIECTSSAPAESIQVPTTIPVP